MPPWNGRMCAMRYLTLVKANIRRQKGSFIGILLLIFIITVSLGAVLTIWGNAHRYVEEEFDRIGYGDLTAWVLDSQDVDALTEQLRAADEVEKVEAEPLIMVNYLVNGKEQDNSGELVIYNTGEKGYRIYNENLNGIEENPQMPEEGEIYVSPSLGIVADAKIGDEIAVQITGEKDVETFTIKGFFEDPISGSAIMGIKSMMINEADMKRLTARYQQVEEDKARGWLEHAIHIWQKEDSSLTSAEFQSRISEETGLQDKSVMIYSKTAMLGFMLMLQDVFSGFLLVFVVVLLVVAMIVIGYGISSSIEQDYVDMGILKAVGFTGSDLRKVQMLQYLLVVLFGMLLGIPISAWVVSVINGMTVAATGIMIPETLPAGLFAAVLGAIFVMVAVFVGIWTGKIAKITPIRAIRGGAEDVYFKSRLTTSIRKSGLGFWLALRQLVSGKRQYLSAGIITVLLVFFLSLAGRVDAWMGEDGEGFEETFSVAPFDLSLYCADSEKREEAERLVESEAQIQASFEMEMEHAALNGMGYFMYILSEPEYYNILEGRTCRYDNELVVTDTVAQELAIGIGDTVEVSFMEHKADFLVTGIYQCTNDMGNNFGVNTAAIARILGQEDPVIPCYTCYQFEDSVDAVAIRDLLEETFGDDIELAGNSWSGTDSIVGAMNALNLLMYVVSIVFILVVVSMTGSKVLYQEKRDLGIYKSLGFASGQLRLAFALRFAIVAATGSLVGSLLSAWLSDWLIGLFLSFCGVSRFTSELTLFQTILPGLVVTVLFFLFAYWAARKIKKVEPGILIVE